MPRSSRHASTSASALSLTLGVRQWSAWYVRPEKCSSPPIQFPELYQSILQISSLVRVERSPDAVDDVGDRLAGRVCEGRDSRSHGDRFSDLDEVNLFE